MENAAKLNAARIRRYVWGLVLVLALTGCSTTTFFYNRLHIFIPWMVDDYVNLNRQQDDQLEQLLVDYLQTHRADYLPRYVDFLDQLISSLDQPLTLEQLTGFYNQAADEVRLLERDALEWWLQLGETLSERQIQEFLEAVEEQQEEYREEYLPRDEEEFREQIYARLEDSLGDFLGRLQPAQYQRLQEAAQQTLRTDRLWLNQREERIEALRQVLARQPGWQQQVRLMVDQQYDEAPVEQTDVYQHNLAVFLQAVVDVVNQRTPRQDRRLRGKLEDLQEDFERLIEQGQDSGK